MLKELELLVLSVEVQIIKKYLRFAWPPLNYLADLFQKPIHAAQWPGALDWAVSAATAAAALAVGTVAVWRYRSRFYFYV